MSSRLAFLFVILAVSSTRMLSTLATKAVADRCACPLHYDPVCASNGITFSNMCLFSCSQAESGLTILHRGECRFKVCPCPKIYAPVCASNGKTYVNRCMLRCAMRTYSNLRFEKDGPC